MKRGRHFIEENIIPDRKVNSKAVLAGSNLSDGEHEIIRFEKLRRPLEELGNTESL